MCRNRYVNTIYVNAHSRSAANNGRSWRTPYLTLQAALVDAAAIPGSRIWIAAGVYTPSEIYTPDGVVGGVSGLDTSALRAFNIPDNTSLFGGFRGQERKLNQRCIEQYETVLSGASRYWHTVIVGNDLPNSVGVIASLDGLTLIEGNASGPANDPSGTLFEPLGYAHNNGGAMYIVNDSSVTVRNCLIRNNRANNIGGAVYTNNSNVSYYQCIFRGNHSDGQAGAAAFYNTYEDAAVPHSAYIYECIFEENSTLLFGGAIVKEGTQPNPASKAVVKGCTFSKNSAHEGGAIVVDSLMSEINDCRFLGNIAYVSGGAVASTNVVRALNAAATSPSAPAVLYPTMINDCLFAGNVCEANQQMRAVMFGGPRLGISFPIGGGAVTSYLDGVLVINNSKFHSNVSYGDGGAILNGKSSVSNPFIAFPGSLQVYAAQTMVNKCEFHCNIAHGNGGAIASERDNIFLRPPIVVNPSRIRLDVFDSVFKGNVAHLSGGAIYVEGSTALLVDNTFRCNKALVGGNDVSDLDAVVIFDQQQLVA